MAGTYDVIVIGVGAMGSSACYHLARRGASVLGLEQFAIGHDRGSSHGQSRMIRMAYYEHPDYVPLLRRAYSLWHELEAASDQKLLYITGGLYLGRPDGGVVAGSLAAVRAHDLPHELLTPDAVTEQFPAFRVPPDWSAVYEPLAGFLLPEAVVQAQASLARSHGAEIHENTPVIAWSGEPSDGVTVRTKAGEYHGRRLIVCGGAWAARLLPALGVPLVVTRQVLGWVQPRRPDTFTLGRFPVWAAENPDGSLQYGFPILPGEQTLKVAWHGAGTSADPDALDRTTSPADAATFLPALPHLLPDACGPVAEMRVCMYTNSPDHHFVVDRLPGEPRVTVACGFSGHGFKFASVIGEVLADLSLDGRTGLPAQFLGLGRFRR